MNGTTTSTHKTVKITLDITLNELIKVDTVIYSSRTKPDPNNNTPTDAKSN